MTTSQSRVESPPPSVGEAVIVVQPRTAPPSHQGAAVVSLAGDLLSLRLTTAAPWIGGERALLVRATESGRFVGRAQLSSQAGEIVVFTMTGAWTAIDSREKLRQPVAIEVFAYESGATVGRPGLLRDLSEGGACIELPQAPAASWIEVSLVREPAHLEGAVAAIERSERGVLVHLAFDPDSAEERAPLVRKLIEASSAS